MPFDKYDSTAMGQDVLDAVQEIRDAATDEWLETQPESVREEVADWDDLTDEQREAVAAEMAAEDVEFINEVEAVVDTFYDFSNLHLIADSYFTEYAREFANDIGAVADAYSWPASHIDWDAAADALKVDYSEVELLGVTFWARD